MAMAAHLQLIRARGPGNLTIGKAELLERQQLIGIQLRKLSALQKGLLGIDNAAQLGQEPGVNAADSVDFGIAASPHHGGSHRENSFRGWGAQQTVHLGLGHLRFRPIPTPAGIPRFQGTHGLLEGLLETAPDRHRLTDRFHRGGQHGRAATEFLERESRNLGDDVINGWFKTRRCLTCDVVEDFVEGVANGQARRNLGDGEAGGFAGERRRSTDPRVHLNHDHIAIGGIDRELNIAAAGGHTDFADNGNGLIAQTLIFAIGQGLRGCHGDRVTRVDTHRVKILDAADDHHVVGEIAHHLQFELLPTEKGLFDQDLGDRAGFESALTDRRVFLWVVGDAATTAAQGEGGTNNPGITSDRSADSLGFLHRRGDSRGTDLHADAFHGLLEQQSILSFLNGLKIRSDQLHPVTLERSVLRQGHRKIQCGLPTHRRKQGIGPLGFDHPGHHVRGQRFDVRAIGHLRVGHDRRRIRIHQHNLEALGPECFAGLGSGIVELTGLTDHNRSRTQQQDAAQIGPPRHGLR